MTGQICSLFQSAARCRLSSLSGSLLLSLFCFHSYAFAQLSVTEVGIDPTSQESFDCIRFTESSQNTIGITDTNGVETFLTPEDAAERVQSSIAQTNRRIRQKRKRLRFVRRRLRSLGPFSVLRPGEVKKRKRLQRLRKKFQRQLRNLRTRKQTLKGLQADVAGCREDETEGTVFRGNLSLVSKAYSFPNDPPGTVRFWVGAYFILSRPVKDFDQFCIRYSGGELDGIIQGAAVRRPQCAAQASDGTCVAEIDVNGFQVGRGFFSGDRAHAVSQLEAEIARYGEVILLGKDDTGTCKKFQ